MKKAILIMVLALFVAIAGCSKGMETSPEVVEDTVSNGNGDLSPVEEAEVLDESVDGMISDNDYVEIGEMI